MKDVQEQKILTPQIREQLLREMWLRHDALWYECYVQVTGMEQLNLANRSIVERLAYYEMTSLVRRMRLYSTMESVGELVKLFNLAVDLYQTRNSPVRITATGQDRFRVEINNCWACRAVERAGLLNEYACGPWKRLHGWLLALGIAAKIFPEPIQCQVINDRTMRDVCAVDVIISMPFRSSLGDFGLPLSSSTKGINNDD